MRNSSRPTVNARDVARLAGVSQSSVSRAFTPGSSLSPAKRQRIEAAAFELGYRPNVLARSLNQRRSRLVGVIGGHLENPFFAGAVAELSKKLSERDLRILLLAAETNASVDRQVEELLTYQVTAVVLMAVSLSSELAMECERAGIPVILFNRTSSTTGTAFEVTGDNEKGAKEIAEHFVSTGKRRIAFMAGYADSSTSSSRERAFCDHLAGQGLSPPMRAVGNFTRAGAAAAARELFASPAMRPDALFCANDLMAIATIETLREEFGLEPGLDYAIAGFDDIPMAAWPSFSLTTYSQPVLDMAEQAVKFILEGAALAGDRSVAVQGTLVRRKSS